MVEIDIEKLKQWLRYKSNNIACESPDDSWDWAMKFAFDWVMNILENDEDYKNMLLDLERWEENE